MLTDDQLATLVNSLGAVLMVLIVIYAGISINSQPVSKNALAAAETASKTQSDEAREKSD
ncbi:hypothetical protein GQ42DRAFT_165154 [Ramicandelaber brevisporus]|nr:hypothetical protein GQ42DRAFT_165154 [Ramicandelaber brevisporus]